MKIKEIIDIIKKSYESNIPLPDVLHEKLLTLYRHYLCIGGLPEVVFNYIKQEKDILKVDRTIVNEIINGYIKDMKKHVSDATESVRIENIYKSIPSQIGNKSGKFQYAKINKNYESALDMKIILKMFLCMQCF